MQSLCLVSYLRNSLYSFKTYFLPQSQWKYRCGNRWGIDDTTNASCMGCGTVQEQFFGCSDISIKAKDGSSITNAVPTAAPTTTVITTQNPTTTVSTKPTDTTPVDAYNGCRSKLYYGKKIDLTKAVSMYCSMICKTTCNEENILMDANEKAIICGQTCPTLCSCV
jgi:hypothetical protein